jgi:hypothetical protein
VGLNLKNSDLLMFRPALGDDFWARRFGFLHPPRGRRVARRARVLGSRGGSSVRGLLDLPILPSETRRPTLLCLACLIPDRVQVVSEAEFLHDLPFHRSEALVAPCVVDSWGEASDLVLGVKSCVHEHDVLGDLVVPCCGSSIDLVDDLDIPHSHVLHELPVLASDCTVVSKAEFESVPLHDLSSIKSESIAATAVSRVPNAMYIESRPPVAQHDPDAKVVRGFLATVASASSVQVPVVFSLGHSQRTPGGTQAKHVSQEIDAFADVDTSIVVVAPVRPLVDEALVNVCWGVKAPVVAGARVLDDSAWVFAVADLVAYDEMRFELAPELADKSECPDFFEDFVHDDPNAELYEVPTGGADAWDSYSELCNDLAIEFCMALEHESAPEFAYKSECPDFLEDPGHACSAAAGCREAFAADCMPGLADDKEFAPSPCRASSAYSLCWGDACLDGEDLRLKCGCECCVKCQAFGSQLFRGLDEAGSGCGSDFISEFSYNLSAAIAAEILHLPSRFSSDVVGHMVRLSAHRLSSLSNFLVSTRSAGESERMYSEFIDCLVGAFSEVCKGLAAMST